MTWIVVPFVAFTALYIFLAFMVVFLLRRQFLESPGPVSKPFSGSHHA